MNYHGLSTMDKWLLIINYSSLKTNIGCFKRLILLLQYAKFLPENYISCFLLCFIKMTFTFWPFQQSFVDSILFQMHS